ncbi:MAG: AAA family ATPase [Alphaproteobacteria bacterium]|nr:AAA family ATPase [Alphaproteobacteria bacterium]
MKDYEAKWDYFDQEGHLIGYVCRFKGNSLKNNGKPSKKIIPYFNEDNNIFKSGIPDHLNNSRPLFGLPSLNNPLKKIYIVEGEKCASALNDLGFQAVTCLGGSNAADLTAWKALKNYNQAVILPDNDDAGRLFAKRVFNQLKTLNPDMSISLSVLPALPVGGDICDYLTANISHLSGWNELSSLKNHPCKNEIYTTVSADLEHFQTNIPPKWHIIESKSGLKALSYKALDAASIPENKILLSPWLNQRSINMVFADRGIGKTFFCLSCAIALAEGSDFLHYKVYQPLKVLYLDGEMQAVLIKQRLEAIIKNKNIVNNRFFIVTPDCQHDRDMPNMSHAEGLGEIDELIKQINPDVIFVDNLSTFIRSGKENEGESWLPVQEWAIRQRSNGRAVVVVHHTNKEGSQRGSSRKEDVMDTIICLKRPDDYTGEEEGARFEIHFTKARHIFGENIRPIDASFKDDKWSYQHADGVYGQAIEMLADKIPPKDIREELNIAASTLSRWKKKAQSEGRL